MNYDQKLRTAMDEIKEVLKKHDIGGFIALNSKTHGEFAMAVDIPTWSKVRFIRDGEAVHIKLHGATDHANTEATVAMIAGIRDLCILGYGQADQMLTKIQEQITVVHVPFGGKGINNEDRQQ